MDLKEVSSNSLAFIGDAYYSLKVREYLVGCGYNRAKDLQVLCNNYVSAKSQHEIFNHFLEENEFSEIELEYFKRGRNHIGHIPKNGDLKTYKTATGFEALVGYLYIVKDPHLDIIFEKMFEWRSAK